MILWVIAVADKIVSLNVSAIERWAVTLTVIGGAIIMFWRPWKGFRERRKSKELTAHLAQRNEMDHVKDSLDKLSEGNKVLLQYRLEKECSKVVARGYITVEQQDLIKSIQDAYENLGGNGSARCLAKRAYEQPLRSSYSAKYECMQENTLVDNSTIEYRSSHED